MVNPVLLRRLITIGLVLIAGVLVYFYFSALLPLLLAVLTALIFEPLVRWLQKRLKTEKRLLPVTIVFTTFCVVAALTFYVVLTRVINMIYQWSFNIPQYARTIQQFVDEKIVQFNEFVDQIPQGEMITAEIESRAAGLTETAAEFTAQLIGWIGTWLQSIPNTLLVTLIYLITFFLISMDLPRLLNLFFGAFKADTSSKLEFVFQRMGKVFLGYWKAQFIMSIGILIVTYIALLFISPSAALIMAIIIWAVDIIPLYVGPALVLVPWAVLEMIMGNTSAGIQLIILALVLLVLRRIIEPKVLGHSIGLNALPTVLSMYVGYVFFGMTGLILGPFVYMAFRSAKESGLFDFYLKTKKV
ncbi:sporulation integral membrane protein YtvI [Paenibacillus daejeonensis]|uniref:sporulation integral membrane protein YtvI n=1 Tax=Paenibacillus daejeonensis TaxID=135193 RepID=UPI000371A195|nr:sporulation integral membrane protein YtvI [Paenibacillus daejeonensis]